MNRYIAAVLSLALTTTTNAFTIDSLLQQRHHNALNKCRQSMQQDGDDIVIVSPVPPPPPISLPVWSFAAATTSNTTSMNIVTYCSAVSIIQPKLWIVSLYNGTRTRESFATSKFGVLQLLKPNQAKLVPILGKQSGYNIEKAEACEKVGIEWCSNTFVNVMLLPNCAAYIALEYVNEMPANDHVVYMCKVVGRGEYNAASNTVEFRNNGTNDDDDTALDHKTVLYTGQLREEGII